MQPSYWPEFFTYWLLISLQLCKLITIKQGAHPRLRVRKMALTKYFNFKFVSYNFRGLCADKFRYINKLPNKTDFLLAQEQ